MPKPCTDRQFDELIEFEWRGIQLWASVLLNWSDTEYHYVELFSERPIPMSFEGYAGQLFASNIFAAPLDLEAFSISWLNKASKSKEWARIQENYAQPSLFD